MLNVLNNILTKYKDKRIVIVSHGTAIVYLFKTWCDIKLNSDNTYSMYFNNKPVFNYLHLSGDSLYKSLFDIRPIYSIIDPTFKIEW